MSTVLFADGLPELREAYSSLLSSRGFQVETAGDGLECLTKLRRCAPDLLVLDLELPWGGGEGVLGLMREDPQIRSIPVVLTSSMATMQVLNDLTRAPVIRALSKPFALAGLLALLSAATAQTRAHLTPGLAERGILVVDDEPGIRTLLQTYLQQQGFRVWTAAHGEDALDLCCHHGDEIAVVLLDVRMPGLDGPASPGGSLREFNPALPVCFMSGDLGEYHPGDLLDRGARYLFLKPFDLEEVGRVVRQLANDSTGTVYHDRPTYEVRP